MNVFELPLFHHFALIYHELDLELVGKTWFVEQLLLLVVEQLPLLVVEQLSIPILLSIRDVVRSLAEVEVTCILFRIRLLQFQSNNFWNTKSWKCFLNDDRIRSSLIECQSLFNRKIDVDPIYRVLMSCPCIVQILCMTWYIQVNLIRILVTFVPRINRQEEYRLSLARILTSRN